MAAFKSLFCFVITIKTATPTYSTAAQHCYKGDVSFLWKKLEL